MIQHREFKELCKKVAEEFPDLTFEQVEGIIKDQFLFAQTHISEGSLTPIYFQYLGRFRAKEGRINWLRNRKKKHDTDTESKLHGEGHTSPTSEE
jgi:hypothetical protein